jgi:hypothetical protein
MTRSLALAMGWWGKAAACFLLLASGAHALVANHDPIDALWRETQTGSEAPILRVTVDSIRYCQGSPTVRTGLFTISHPDEVLLRLSLTLENVTAGNLIIFRREAVVSKVEYRSTGVSETSELPLGHPIVTPEDYDRDDWPAAARPPGRDFVVLKPGETWTASVHPIVGFSLRDEDVRPGTLVVQPALDFWSRSPEVTQRVRERWKATGELLASPVDGSGFQVEVLPPEKRRYSRCR